MGFGDIFKASENQELRQRIAELEALVTPEMRDVEYAKRKLDSINQEISLGSIKALGLEADLLRLRSEIENAKVNLIETNEAALMQEFGLYEPKFKFANSDLYKSRLLEVRALQKDMIKDKSAATGNTGWTVNNNAAKGRKMVADMQKLLIRAFNSECDDVIGNIKFNNIEAGLKRITASRDAISKLGDIMSVSITPRYYKLKIDELHLAYEYQVKKQEEKEEQRRIKEDLREQAALQKEIEEARKKIAKDRQHYENALEQAKTRLESESNEARRADLEAKMAVYIEQLEQLDKDMQAVDYRAANQTAGYVYVISNIGAFGDNVFKIGMTRRLDPMDRVDELGDASVPFKFDVHAMIFTDDAPKLENALHHAFEHRKVNMVNGRREFFRASLNEIKRVVRDNFDKTVEFIDTPDAEQYRQTLLMQKDLAHA